MGSWGVWSSSIRKPLPSVKRAKGLWGPIYVFEKKNSLLGSTPILLSPTLVKFPFIVYLSGLHDPEHCHRCLVKMLASGPPSASQSPWVLFILIPVQKPGEKEHFLCARRGGRRIQWNSYENWACGRKWGTESSSSRGLFIKWRETYWPLLTRLLGTPGCLIGAHQKLPFGPGSSGESSSWPAPNYKAFLLARETSDFQLVTEKASFNAKRESL